MRKFFVIVAVAVAASCWANAGQAAHKWGLKEGKPELLSAGQLAFGPDGILFVGDTKGAAIFAIDTTDTNRETASAPRNVERLNERLAELFGGTKVALNDLAVNPLSGNVYLSVSLGDELKPALARVEAEGKLSAVSLSAVPFSKAAVANPPEDKITGEGPRARNRRNDAITDLAFAQGKLLVSGLTNEAASSKVREFAFPFSDSETGTNIEIYHAAHGKLEDNAPIRTFVPFIINNEASLVAGFTCTPLVRFPVDGLSSGKKVRGTTVAELGNRNQPLDMIVYEKNGQKYLLMANSARGVMKINTQEIGRKEGLTDPVSGGGTAGQTFETIKDLEGTVQLDRLTDEQAVVVIQQDGVLALRTVPLP